MAELEDAFKQRGDILKSQLTFKNCGMTFRQFKDAGDFVKNYPFAPYQFQLIQKIFEAIRKAGATGMHLARGERSMLDAFQSAAKAVSLQEVGILVPLYDFYPLHRKFPRYGGKEDDRSGGNEPEPATLRYSVNLRSSSDSVCGRDERKRGQPRDPMSRSDRRRSAGPAPPDRGKPWTT